MLLGYLHGRYESLMTTCFSLLLHKANVSSKIESNATVKFHKQKQDKQDEWSSLLDMRTKMDRGIP